MFSLTPAGDQCGISDFKLVSSDDTPYTLKNMQLTSSGNVYSLNLDKSLLQSDMATVYLKATTKGLNSARMQYNFVVCNENSVEASVSKIEETLSPLNLNYAVLIKDLFKVSNC